MPMNHSLLRATLGLSTLTLGACLALGCTVAPDAGKGSSGGSSSGGGGSSSGGSSSGGATGNVDAPIVGIWQETVASGGDFQNTSTGATFSVTQGYSARLKIRADGRYSFQHYSAGASSTCSSVTAFDKSVGVADFKDGKLVLRPSERTIDVHACADSGLKTMGTEPMEWAAEIAPYETLAKETTRKVTLTGGPYPLTLKLLQLDPASQTSQPPQPAGFQLGADPPYDVFIGSWAPSSGSDLGFYDPSSGDFYVPKYNGAEHKWLKFVPGGYEMATVLENAAGAGSGVCKKDLVYWEKGTATFSTLKVTNDTYEGDARFQATEARLVVNVTGCEEDDGAKSYSVKPLSSYFKWQYTAQVGFLLGCEYDKTPFQFATCTNNVGWNTYRKR